MTLEKEDALCAEVFYPSHRKLGGKITMGKHFPGENVTEAEPPISCCKWKKYNRSAWECNGGTKQKCHWGHGNAMSGHVSILGEGMASRFTTMYCMAQTWLHSLPRMKRWSPHFNRRNHVSRTWILALPQKQMSAQLNIHVLRVECWCLY